MGSEKFCLRWNDFETNISSSFRELRDDKDFFDVTLACDDEQIQAHKVILSACSPFFRNILRRNVHPNPLLYLKGVKYADIQAVLNFMYHGEVNVAQEELNSFLAVAEDLRVKGLTQNQSESQKPLPVIKTSSQRVPGKELPHPPTKCPRPAPAHVSSSLACEDDIVEYVPVKSEPRESLTQETYPPDPPSHPPSHALSTQDPYHPPPPSHPPSQALSTQDLAFQETESYDDYGQYSEAGYEVGDNTGGEWEGNKGDISAIIVQVDPFDKKSPWNCLLCGKVFQCKGNGRRHVETMHYKTPSVSCEICGNVLKNKNSYQNHMTIVHGHNKGLRKNTQFV